MSIGHGRYRNRYTITTGEFDDLTEYEREDNIKNVHYYSRMMRNGFDSGWGLV
jgi:hypothetical protein